MDDIKIYMLQYIMRAIIMMIDMITCELTVTALNGMKIEMFISNRPHMVLVIRWCCQHCNTVSFPVILIIMVGNVIKLL